MTKRSELVLPPGTYAYSLDKANAQLSVLVGPIQNKLEELEGTVTYDAQKGRMVGCPIDRAIRPVTVVSAGSYAVVTNPFVVGDEIQQPPARKKTQVNEVELQYGRTVHIPGPTALVPWPGQDVTVQEGYRLEPHQYIIVEVMGGLSAQAAEACKHYGIDPLGRTVVKSSMLDGETFIPPTGVRVLGGTKAVKTAVQLGPLDWARVVRQDGEQRYCRGPGLVFPGADETVGDTGQAYDLRKVGLHLRKLGDRDDAVQACTEWFLTSFGDNDAAAPYYWPNVEEEIVDVVCPVDIPVGGGVYYCDVGDSDVKVYDTPGPVLFNPLKHRVVERAGKRFAPVVTVGAGEAVEIKSPTSTRYLMGPQHQVLQYRETEGKRVNLIDRSISLSLVGVSRDGISINFNVCVTAEYIDDIPSWFTEPCSKTQALATLQREFVAFVSTVSSDELTPESIQNHLASIEVPNVRLSNLACGTVDIGDKSIAQLLSESKRGATVLRLTEQKQQYDREYRKAADVFSAAVAQMEREKAELLEEMARAKITAEETRQRLKIEHEKERQQIVDEVQAAELDRKARIRQQDLEFQAKANELERQMIEARSRAQVELLSSLQPELVAAIKAAGAQTSFSKVVQHLGPSSILQGIGLQDAVKRIIGDDAASSMLLTGTPTTDKPNGTKRSAAES